MAVTTASSVSTQRPLTQAAHKSGAARQIKEQRRRTQTPSCNRSRAPSRGGLQPTFSGYCAMP